jgi:hypothetical protein
MHRLTTAAVAWILGREGRVRIRQPRVEFVGECVAVIRHKRHLAGLVVFVSWR